MHWNQLLYLDPLNTSYHYSKDPHPLCSVCMTERERENQRGSEKAHKTWQRCKRYTFCPCWMKIGTGAHWINRKRERKNSIKKERDCLPEVITWTVNIERKQRSRLSLMQKERSSCKRERKNRKGRLNSKWLCIYCSTGEHCILVSVLTHTSGGSVSLSILLPGHFLYTSHDWMAPCWPQS